MIKMLSTLAIIAAGWLALSETGHARDLQLTPNHVFSIWTNINDCLIAYAQKRSSDASWQEQLSSITPRTFTDKQSSDILEQVKIFQANLDRLRMHDSLPPAAQIPDSYDQVTPRIVYVNSSLVQDALVESLIIATGPEQLVSQFFTRHEFTGKTPSDIYALVDLANRRLDRILSASDLL